MKPSLPRAYIRRALSFITCVLLQHTVSAQQLSNAGTDFWVGYGHHQFMEPGMGNSQELVLHISAEQAANVTVSIHGTAWVRHYSIPANTAITTEYLPKAGFYDARLYSVPPSFGGTGGEGIFASKGIHIESDVPVVANVHMLGSASSGSSMLLPSNTWGYEYLSLNSQQYYQDNAFSWLFVIAKEDNTVIEITPSKPTRNGRMAGVPFTATLSKGQIYQLLGASLGAGFGNDLTGTKVRAIQNSSGECHPIGVFSGSSRTYISCPGNYPGGGDYIIQQLLPRHTWGQRYLTAPFSNAIAADNFRTDIYRVLVSDPATVVRRNGVALGPLTDNAYYEFQSNTADLIEADKPVMVAQYMSSASGCNNTTGLGDPEMVYLSPLAQGVKKTVFTRTSRESINNNYVTLIVPDAGLASLRIDGAGADHVYPHPQLAGYSVAVKRYNALNASGIITCDQPFTGITYGLGSVESYGYNVGMNLWNLNGFGRIRNAESSAASSEYTCQGTPAQLSVFLPYLATSLNWKISAMGGAITPNTDVLQNMPSPIDTVRVDGVLYYQYVLPQPYTFSAPGDYAIPVEAAHSSINPCNHTETINIPVEVRAGPQATAAFSNPTACTLDTVQLSAGTTSGAFTFDRWVWSFPDGSTINAREAKKLYPPGTHKTKLRAVTTIGCVSLDSVSFTIHDRPTASFNSAVPAVCEEGAVTFTDNGSAYAGSAAISGRSWDFGNGAPTLNSGNASEQATFNTYGSYEVKMVAKVSDLCISDTARRTITVHANPSITLTMPGNCLPADRSASFTSNAATPDGQTISSYQWNFGDGTGTSTDKDPVYTYAGNGTYPVHYAVTTSNGCTSDSTFNVTVAAKPELSYSVVPPVCEDATGPASVAQASVLNGATGAGIYSGPGITDDGALQAGIAGAGTHTAKYIFTTTEGCKDSVSTTFTIRAKPVLSLTLPEGCLPVNGEAAFSSNATTPDGQAVTGYQWNFGDGSPLSADKDPVHHYTAPGTFNVSYTATTVNGCTNDTSVQVKLGMLPDLAYSVIPPVCISTQGPASVANASVVNNLPGSGIYTGEGVSTTGILNPAIAGAGTHPVKYIFTTTDGCVDSVSTTLTIRAKPLLSLTLPEGCLPVNGEAAFSSNATTPDGQAVTGYQWNFGDGSPLSADKNPVHHYAAPGTFNVTYTATTVNGCTNDTSVQVKLGMLPDLAYSVIPPVCVSAPGPVTVATASVENNLAGTGIYRGAGVSANGSFAPAVAGVGQHAVKYIFTTTDGCVDSASSSITVNALPVAGFVASLDSVCQGGSVTFTNMSTGGASAWNWNFGDGGTASAASPTHRFNTAGDFAVSLRVTDGNGCVSEPFSLPVVATVLPVIDAGPSFTVKQGAQVQFSPTANNTTQVTFHWSPAADFIDPNVLRASLVATRDAVYTLTATSGSNCSATDQVTVTIIKAIDPPNVFSPNGDNINDTWVIRELVHYPNCIVEIFNRYGQRLFRSNGYGAAWDGKYRGEPLPIGTYYYVIHPGDGGKPVSGSVTILK
ncbi:PKD domain-containing protein [Chitinophaga sp. 22620]|uniref:gliding motility-associated C-terminal domain-containing protein n=1 Tax=Chitinophaga sp. 22620 TaxID=3453952 RepID=UPI003F82994D